jgi:hypothetical protein
MVLLDDRCLDGKLVKLTFGLAAYRNLTGKVLFSSMFKTKEKAAIERKTE